MPLKDRLPEDFIRRMSGQLREETEAFLNSYEAEACAGIRVNIGKLSVSEAKKELPFSLQEIPWTENGFYLDRDADASASRHPYYYAGLYYLQEPSAMLPASLLPVCPDDRVLDLCAAPGGKATELASRLSENGLLVANDVSAGRAGALLKNLTIWGMPNVCITVETPQRLYESFGCYFDKILVDAPCSGEGMFRKDSHLISSWKEKGPSYYAPLQKEILSCAVKMLKPGGMLLYSTCTFSTLEDEEVVFDVLQKTPELELVSVPFLDGFRQGFTSAEGIGPYPDCLSRCVRLYPHRIRGEGHFVALFHKINETDRTWGCGDVGNDISDDVKTRNDVPVSDDRKVSNAASGGRAAGSGFFDGGAVGTGVSNDRKVRNHVPENRTAVDAAPDDRKARFWESQSGRKQIPKSVIDFFSAASARDMRAEAIFLLPAWHYEQIGEKCLLVPPCSLPSGIRYLRTGLLLGTLKNGRFEPSQALAMLPDAPRMFSSLSLSLEDERVIRYLKGETLALTDAEADAARQEKGGRSSDWVLVCVDGYGLGWGRIGGSGLKNKYYPGWRLQ
ncbi:MAG: RsmB/NOP family class I SAM-dependent RNA methyltransferase [Lachnospiraceae bacterium]|nr:RsmB/NOP family class I SAM-dependent RNA methyltransferase [Lachnospiraceae bacterium]